MLGAVLGRLVFLQPSAAMDSTCRLQTCTARENSELPNIMQTYSIDYNQRSKYGLATQERMMHAHGPNQGSAIDIGCSHRITLYNSSIGALAQQLNHSVLVDAFHGNAHNRRCQLENLTTYVEGVGLEKLGVCEQAFSMSNTLAGSTRSMSTFHRRQAISE